MVLWNVIGRLVWHVFMLVTVVLACSNVRVASGGRGPALQTNAAPSAQGPVLSTPGLIEQAFKEGEITDAERLLHLGYAIYDYSALPQRFRSNAPWSGTSYVRELRTTLTAIKSGQGAALAAETQSELERLLSLQAATVCDQQDGANATDSANFHLNYDSVGGGLAIGDYSTALETTFSTEVTLYGWPKPPYCVSGLGTCTSSNPWIRYPVQVMALGGGLYGYVTYPGGSYTGELGNNPNTPATETQSRASCMVLNRDFSGFPGGSQYALDVTAAHEFVHAIQFGVGDPGAQEDIMWYESSAAYMEDEVFDNHNDNYQYLWPPISSCLGQYQSSDPYANWLFFRYAAERNGGTNQSGGGEDVMQAFWANVAAGQSGLAAYNNALGTKSSNLADTYHSYAIASRFSKSCPTGSPYCYEEGAGYISARGANANHGNIASIGGSYAGSLANNYATHWIGLPTSGIYAISLENTSASGKFRVSIVADTGSSLKVTPFPQVVEGNKRAGLVKYQPPSGATSVVAVITNQDQTGDDPTSCANNAYRLNTVPTLAVTPPGYDNIGVVLARPELGYPWTQIQVTDLANSGVLAKHDVVFINCASNIQSNDQSAAALRQYVQNGGSIYASDWAYAYIQSAFPGYINFPASPKIGTAQQVVATITDSGLASYINSASPPATINLNYNLGAWVVIDSVGANTTVHLRGSINTNTLTGLEQTASERRQDAQPQQGMGASDQLANRPLVVSFRPYGTAGGRVVYTTFHNEAQQSSLEQKLLEYLVLLPFTSAQQQAVAQAIQAEGLDLVRTDLNTVNPGATSPLVSYSYTRMTGDPRLAFVLAWQGSTLRLSVQRPNGSIYQVTESNQSPLKIVVPDAETGTWRYQITGVDVPYSNYPYVVGVGTKIRKLYIPSVRRTASTSTGFDSQFNDSATGWTSVAGNWGLTGNAWYMSYGVVSKWASANYPATFANFDFQAQLFRYGCDYCANHLIVRGTANPLGADNDWYSYYIFQYNRYGQFSVWKRVAGGSYDALQIWSDTAAVNKYNAWNVLRVIASGGNLSFYINGVLVWAGTDSSLSSGRVGIGMYRAPDSSGDQLYVDWATLSTLGVMSSNANPANDTVSPEQQLANEMANQTRGDGANPMAP